MKQKEERKILRERLILRASVLNALRQSVKNRTRRRFALFLAGIVVFTTTYSLILPALTLENNTVQKLAGMDTSVAKAELLDCHVDIHQHTDDCFQVIDGKKTLVCGQADYVLHTHDENCYDGDGNLVCTLPEIPHAEKLDKTDSTANSKNTANKERNNTAISEEAESSIEDANLQLEPHTHTLDCYEKGPGEESPEEMGWVTVNKDGSITGDPEHLICGKLEVKEHQHTSDCFTKNSSEQSPDQDTSAEDSSDTSNTENGDSIKSSGIESENGQTALADSERKDLPADDSYPSQSSQSQTGETTDRKNADKKEADTSEITEDSSSKTDDLNNNDRTADSTVPDNSSASNNTNYKEESESSINEHKSDEKTTTNTSGSESAASEKEKNNSDSNNNDIDNNGTYKKFNLDFEGEGYTVRASGNTDACVPEGSTLEVSEIQSAGASGNGSSISYAAENFIYYVSSESVYEYYLTNTEKALGWERGSASYARFFDIKIVDQNGEKVEIAAPVDVEIELRDKENNSKISNNTQVVHFADGSKNGDVVEDVETAGVKSKKDNLALSFKASCFSVYAIIDAPGKSVNNLAELSCNTDKEFYLSVKSTDYFQNSVNKNGAFNTGTFSEADGWYFEPGGSENQYYIYTYVNNEQHYMKNTTDNKMGLTSAKNDGTVFEISQAADGLFYIKKYGDNKWLQYSGTGKGIRLWTDNNNSDNSKVAITYASSLDGLSSIDPYELDGKSFGIAYHNDNNTAAAMLSEQKNDYHLTGQDMLIRPDVLYNRGTLLVAENSDISMWTFKCVEEDKYYIISDTGKYLTLNGQALTLSNEPDPTNSVFKVVPGVGSNIGKYSFTVNNQSIELDGSSVKGFWGTKNNSTTKWLNLVEKSHLTEDGFVNYSARKISVSDESLSATEKDANGNIITESAVDENGNEIQVPVYKEKNTEIVIYTRIWNETAKKYEFYAVDHDGSMVRVYDSGDLINWVGNSDNSVRWEFIEHTEKDGSPNYYYDLKNVAYANTFLAPQAGSIIAGGEVGVQLAGRKDGFDYTTVLAWDDITYSYYGLKVVTDENGMKRAVSCAMDDADDFYFATVVPQHISADPLTTVSTVDNDEHGIKIRMIDFNNDNLHSGYDTIQHSFFGSKDFDSQNSHVADTGLLTDYLIDGYPSTTGKHNEEIQSLSELYKKEDLEEVNHLFIQSVYKESGYFEYDSTQNFAHLNNTGNFTVYDQLGAIGTSTGATRTHGQFMPYNDISQKVGYAYDTSRKLITNKTNVLAQELPDSEPRKGEPLYLIPDKEADYHFGMELSASFTQTPNGVDNWGHDIIFEFTGDDDFWFYVDGELVLDLGGVHSAMGGSVNFRTGEVTCNGTHSTLYDIFKAHYEAREYSDVTAKLNEIFEEKTVNNKTVYVFRDYSTHTMKMFYMERGAGASNLKMRFNLASVQPGTVELSKKLTGTQSASNKLMQYPYQIWYATAEYKTNEDGSYVIGEDGKPVVDHYNDPTLMEQADSSSNPTCVVYKGTNTLVPFRESVTIDGIEYHNVFLLKPGESAIIKFPENTYQYKTIECGVNTEVYEKVFVNETEITSSGKLYHNTDGDSGPESVNLDPEPTVPDNSSRKDFGIDYKTTTERPRVEYNNQVAPDAMRTLSFKKTVYDNKGVLLSDEEAAKVDAKFRFRLYLGNEFADENNLPLADMYAYCVKDPGGQYCKRNSSTGKYEPINITQYEGTNGLEEYLKGLSNTEKAAIVFKTSMYGTISNIPAGFTVEVHDLIVGTKYKIEERDGEIPRGYTRRSSDGYVRTDTDPDYVYYTDGGIYGRHELTDDSKIAAEPVSDTIESKTESPIVEIRNQEGWGLTAKKVWTDKDFMTHDPIYLAIYLQDTTNNTLLEGTVRRLKNNETDVYWFFPDLHMNGKTYSFNQFIVREVILNGNNIVVNNDTGVVSGYDSVTPVEDRDSIELSGTPVGGTGKKTETYTVTYDLGDPTGRNTNIRTDTVTNSRPGIQIFKTNWEETEFLSGATFTLKDSQGHNVAADSYTSDNRGLVTTAYLSPGTYTLAEIRTPNGFVAFDGTISIIVSKNNVTGKDIISVTGPDGIYRYADATENNMACIFVHNRTVQNLTVKKVDKESALGTPVPLSGAHFALYEQVLDHNNNPVKATVPKIPDIVTDNDGILQEITMDLGPGTYYLEETQAPSGYKKLAEDLCFTIGKDGTVKINNTGYSNWLTKDTSVPGTISYQINIENTPLGITVRKTDESGNALTGSKFKLYKKNDDTSGFVIVTEYGLGEDGLIDLTKKTEMTFTGMANGLYQLTETNSPPGYNILTKDIYFKVSSGSVTLTDQEGNTKQYSDISLHDDNTTIAVKNSSGAALPNTGGPGTMPLTISGLLLMMISGIWILLYRKAGQSR